MFLGRRGDDVQRSRQSLTATGITPALLGIAAIVTNTGWSPGFRPAGAIALTCAKPAYPGAMPAKSTCARLPPMDTSTCASTVDNGVAGALTPSAMGGVTAPCPVM